MILTHEIYPLMELIFVQIIGTSFVALKIRCDNAVKLDQVVRVQERPWTELAEVWVK